MASTRDQLYKSLKEGQIIGPEHHRFQLKGSPTPCSLGQFWQADDMSTAEPIPVSLFVLTPELLQHKPFLNSFKRQIVRAKGIGSRHVADIYGYFIHKGGLLFFSCEALDGLSLQSLLLKGSTKKLQSRQVQGLLTQLAGAIEACAQHWREPHASLAPDIVYINKQGGVKLLPLSARDLLKDASAKLNPACEYPGYRAPETFKEETLDLPTDVFSLAAISYAIYQGQAPFDAKDGEAARMRHQLSKPSALLDSQWLVLQQGLKGEPTDRQSRPIELIKALFADQPSESAADESALEDIAAEAEATEQQARESSKQQAKSSNLKRWLLPSGLFVFGLAAGFALGLLLSSGQVEKINDGSARLQAQALKMQALIERQQQQIADLEKAPTLESSQAEEDAAKEPEVEVFRDELGDGLFGPDMVNVAAGSFQMGDISGSGSDNERPAHPVTFAQGYALSRFEITFAQYDLFAEKTGRALPDDNGWGRGEQPVINVSWDDANAYANWLSQMTGMPYRLPSEAEWEYAARAGSNTEYWWGDTLMPGQVNCEECDAQAPRQPVKVGSYPANPWGFYDLNGNVDEWVADCYLDEYNRAPADGSAYLHPNCTNRAMRGGSWFDTAKLVRSASRYRHPAQRSRDTWGFRVALDLTE